MTTGRGSSALHLIYRQRLLSVFKTLRSALTTLPPLRKQASAGGENSLRSAKVGNGISLTDRHRAGSRPSFLFDLIGLTASMKRPQAGETSAPARACRAAQVVLPRGASRRLGPAGGERRPAAQQFAPPLPPGLAPGFWTDPTPVLMVAAGPYPLNGSTSSYVF
jgi:hypothetical protein